MSLFPSGSRAASGVIPAVLAVGAVFLVCDSLPAAEIPETVWATHLGGSDVDEVRDVAVDTQGNVIVVGRTLSIDFPIQNAFDPEYSGGPEGDAFVSKFAEDGSLLWSTYLGGSDSDEGFGIDTDTSGNIYVTGYTSSSDFPVTGWYDDSHNGGRDVFLVHLSPEGSLLRSTYLGGGDLDEGYGINTDVNGGIVLCGSSFSVDFPPDGQQIANGDEQANAFVSYFGPNKNLVWSAFAGDYGLQAALATEVANGGYIYYVGFWEELALVAKLDPSGQPAWTHFLENEFQPGTSLQSISYDLILDSFDCPIVLGSSECEYQRSTYWWGWYRRFLSDGQVDIGSALHGGPQAEYKSFIASGIAADRDLNIYICGWSAEYEKCTFGYPFWYCEEGVTTWYGDSDILHWNEGVNGFPLLRGLLGGAGPDFARAIATDAGGMVYIVGDTLGFEMAAGFDTTPNGLSDGFVAALDHPYPNRSAFSPRAVPFGSQVTVCTGQAYALWVDVADIDRDGDSDVIGAFHSPGQVITYMNDGGRLPAFHAVPVSAAGRGANVVNVDDIDGDGDPDVFGRDFDEKRFFWLENQGTDTVSFAGHTVSTLFGYSYSIGSADLDGDGDIDLITRNGWFENQGGDPPSFYAHLETGGDDYGDIDEDGDLDLSIGGQGNVILILNSGETPPRFSPLSIPATPGKLFESVLMADFDRDGDEDLVGHNSWSAGLLEQLFWFDNISDASLDFDHKPLILSPYGALSTTLNDVDRDGDWDIIAAVPPIPGVFWQENDGASTPVLVPRCVSGKMNTREPRCFAGEDLDKDGDTDIVSAFLFDGKIAWYPNLTIHRNAEFPVRRIVSDTGRGAMDVVAADVDRDGDPDLISALAWDSRIAWYENPRDKSQPFLEQTVSTEAGGVRSLAVGDLDRDGDLDVVAACADENAIAWFANDRGTPISFHREVISASAEGAACVDVADLDRDGDLDVISASLFDDRVAWYENGRDDPLAWTEHTMTHRPDGPAAVIAADLDRDGDPDIVSASLYDRTVGWFENDGERPPGFFFRTIDPDIGGVWRLGTADIDRDGDPDILFTSAESETVGWFENSGETPPGFVRQSMPQAYADPSDVMAEDLDMDGDYDLAVSFWEGDSMVWSENIGGASPEFTEHLVTRDTDGASAVLACDLDLDGDSDLVSASEFDGEIAWYENLGGQYGMTGLAVAPDRVDPGATAEIFKIEIRHNGREGDTDAEIDGIVVRFCDVEGIPLSRPQAEGVLQSVNLHRDTGSGQFEEESDPQIASASPSSLNAEGELRLRPQDDDPASRIPWNQPGTFFVTAVIADTASQSRVQAFLTSLIARESRIRDADHNDIPLVPAWIEDVSSEPIVIPQQPTPTPGPFVPKPHLVIH